MPRARLAKHELDAQPYRAWNAYIGLLADTKYEDLTPKQRPAHLVFWYESEVQNGGHLQYFENLGILRLAETVDSLGLLGAACQQDVLRTAGALWASRSRSRITTVEEFVSIALEGEFSKLNARFHACCPSLQQVLEAHLRDHMPEFIEVE